MDVVDDFLAYPLGTRKLAKLLDLRREIGRRCFDVAFALTEARGRSKTFRDWLFFRSCGIKKIIGSPWRGRDLLHRPSSMVGLYEPEALRVVRRIGADSKIDLTQDCWWDLHLNALEKEQANSILTDQRIRGFIGLSLGAKVDVKDWGLPNWRNFILELGRRYSHLALIGLGVAEERQMTSEALKWWPGTTLNLCGQLSPRISAALLRKASVFVGHDSGPMHLAAAVGTKCVAIFSARLPPGVWFPHGSGNQILYHQTECFNCGLSVCHRHLKKCILSISVEEVLRATEKILKPDLMKGKVIPSTVEQIA